MPRNLAFTALRQAACARPQVLPLATTATRVGSTRQHATRFPHLLSRRSTTTSTITTEEDGFAWLRDDELEETGGTRPYLQKKTHRTKHLKQDETEDGGLDSLGTEAEVINGLYDLLRRQAGQGKIDHTQKIAEELVGKREQEPNLRIYSALIIANVHAEHGSVADIKRLLRDMSEQGLIPDAAICHNILKVLSVHPDCFLRDRIVADMRERWLPISVYGRIDVLISQLREGLLEQALDTYQNDVEVIQKSPKWLRDLLIYHVCDAGELDQALRLLKDRVAASEANISPSLWYYLFDHACSKLHYDTIEFTWRYRVDKKHLNPTSGQCIQALIAAARRGDVHIATEVFRILSDRQITFKQYHYELLLEANIVADDLRTALIVLCIMHSVQIRPELESLTSLRKYISNDPSGPEQAFEILKELRVAREVPNVAVNVVILGLVDQNRHEDVITTYKSLHRISSQGPNVHTFNAIFRSCHRNRDKKTAMFFAAEMVELKIKPDSLTYDRLLLTCLHEPDYEDAFRYYEEMMAAGYVLRRGTWLELIRVCSNVRDERAFEVLAKMAQVGFPTGSASAFIREAWPDTGDGEVVLRYENR